MPDHDDLVSNRSKIMNVIGSRKSEREAGGKPVSTFSHPALERGAQVAQAAMVIVSLMLFAGFFGALHPAFDSLSHFRVYLAMLLGLLAVPFLFTPERVLALSALVFALVAFSTTLNAPKSFGFAQVQAGVEPGATEGAVYRLLQMNLRFNNPTPEQVLSLIGRTKPDVVTLDEVSTMWDAKLDLLANAYPYRIICPRRHNAFSVAILSRRPLSDSESAQCFERGSMAVARVDFGGSSADIAAIHLGWPWPFEQAQQINILSEPLALLGETALMAGDLNATPWSFAARRVAEAGKLELMPSVGVTWHYIKLPDFMKFAGLPLDHVFSKGNIIIHSAKRLESAGSDHLPILVEFSIIPKPQQPDDDENSTATVSAAHSRG